MTLEDEVVLLRAANAALRVENAALRERIGELEQQIAELEGRGRRAPSFVKPNRSKSGQAKKPRRKREAQHNRGRKREEPTKVRLHQLEHCPDCSSRLYRRKAVSPRRARGPNGVAWRRQVIELPAPQAAEVTEHVVVKRWCAKCAGWRGPHVDWQGLVVGQGRLGVRLVSVIAYLRTTLRLPLRQIQGYLETLHGGAGERWGIGRGTAPRAEGRARAAAIPQRTDAQQCAVAYG